MSNELIKYAFTGGEVSPTLYGRSDLEQYDLGLALAKNWFVDYRGGLSTRPGFEFCEFIMHDDLETRFFEFRFSPDDTNVYLLLFGNQYIRFIQDGSYVVEDPKTITGLSGDVVTSAAHGYANGDWIKINSVDGIGNINTRTFQVANVTTDTYQLLVVPSLTPFVPSGAYVSGGQSFRIYTVASPYLAYRLPGLVIDQWRDQLRITHRSFGIRNLKRIDNTNWVLSFESTSSGTTRVSGVSAAASASGSAATLFSVTGVMEDGTETLMSTPLVVDSIVNYTTTAGSVTVKWNILPGAVYYNVYRSVVMSEGTKLTRGAELGYVGKVSGTQFTDNNIIPDFTKTPPVANNPFASGSIEYIQVTNAGTGFGMSPSVTVTDPNGTGFIGFAISDDAGTIRGVKVISGGSGYTNPTITFGGGGSGATATATMTSATGNLPTVSAIFQQRQLYASTVQNPLTVWGSRPKKFSNFTYSELTLDNDSYEFELDSREVTPILHMVPMRGGLVLMSKAGVWQLSGGNSGIVTPTNALADPQTYTGVSTVPPLTIGSDILYSEGKGSSVRLLSYNEYAKVYAGEDKSILSNHLFAKRRRITSWGFAENPYKIVYAIRSDGALLNFTFVKEEKVAAWTWGATKGQFTDCKVIQENTIDRLYVTTRRFINGRWTKFVERGALREYDSVEDAFCVDCGLVYPQTYPNATLDSSAASGEATFTASAPVFGVDVVDSVIRVGGGKAVVLERLSDTQVRVEIVRPILDVMFEDSANRVLTQAAGTWTMDQDRSVIGGLWHLEGETVSILADGSALPERVVTNGQIILSVPATKIVIGLPYTCVARSLSPVVSDAVIEGRRKRVVGVATRTSDTVGLYTGNSLDNLYPSKQRTDEAWGEPTDLFSGIAYQLIDPVWDESGQSYFVQQYPLPATLLGIVFDIEVGDDTE